MDHCEAIWRGTLATRNGRGFCTKDHGTQAGLNGPAGGGSILRPGPRDHFFHLRDFVRGAFGERAFGFVIILFSLPNCIPAPPGMNSVFGLPVLLFAFQLALGFKKPWLPRKIMDKAFRISTFRKIIDIAEPKLARVEKVLRPRHTGLFGVRGDRLIGVFAIILALCVIVPLPGTNWVPSIALVILSMAIMQEDGLVLGFGVLAGIAGIVYTVVLTSTLLHFALLAVGRAFGY